MTQTGPTALQLLQAVRDFLQQDIQGLVESEVARITPVLKAGAGK